MWRDRLRLIVNSFWFIPATCTVLAVVAALVLVRLTRRQPGTRCP